MVATPSKFIEVHVDKVNPVDLSFMFDFGYSYLQHVFHIDWPQSCKSFFSLLALWKCTHAVWEAMHPKLENALAKTKTYRLQYGADCVEKTRIVFARIKYLYHR
jgi:hypothetical protein